jgi:Chitin binding Peritrophin-A domain
MNVLAILVIGFVATASADQCRSDNVGSMFAIEGSCSKFRQCTPVGEMVYTCPEGTFFNAATNVCDCGAGKQCGGLGYDICPPTVESDVCEGRKVGELVGNPETCEAFYQCGAHGPSLMECPEGKSFNLATKTCDLTANAKCRLSRGCCMPQRQSSCCRGPPRCKPCGMWMVKKICCVKCVQCNPCHPCNQQTTTTAATTTSNCLMISRQDGFGLNELFPYFSNNNNNNHHYYHHHHNNHHHHHNDDQ